MAFGIDQAGLPAVQAALAQLPGIEKFTDDEREKLTATVAKIASDSITQAGSVFQADLKPALEQIAAFNVIADKLVGLLARVLDDGIVLGGKRA